MIQEVKFRAGKYLVKGTIDEQGNRIYIDFPYNVIVKDEVKALDGARFHGYDEDNPRKIWSIKKNRRNDFRLGFLLGKNVYENYDKPLIDYSPKPRMTNTGKIINHYDHQIEMIRFEITRKQCLIAAEMRTGKTLAAIETMEYFKFLPEECLWVGPRSALAGVNLEFWKWNAKIWPTFITYNGLVSMMEKWSSGKPAPKLVIFDESTHLKNWSAQRTQAAFALAESMRNEYGNDAVVIEMSGAPSPQSPADWWSQCEIVCPGFLKESNVHKFRNRLSLTVMKQSFDGANYPKLVGWYDNEKKCKICCQAEEGSNHDIMNIGEGFYHTFVPSVNEVALLYKRFNGIVIVKRKKDCLSLPAKQFQIIECKPSKEILEAAKMIAEVASTSAKALVLLRELSDGFQYRNIEDGEDICPTCKGTQTTLQYYDINNPDELLDAKSIEIGHKVIYNDEGVQIGIDPESLQLGTRPIGCHQCGGKGLVPKYSRDTFETECPKDKAVLDLLDQYSEDGRTVFWAGFTGSIDRLTKLIIKAGWQPIRCDGRGMWSPISGSSTELLRIFDQEKAAWPKIAWIGQPGAGGMGIDLTASAMCCYFSNTFKAEDRLQSMERIHGPGTDVNRGATIYDLIHLPTDLKVLQNLNDKNDLQNLTLGVLKDSLDNSQPLERYMYE